MLLSRDDIDETAGCLIHADAVCETTVRRTRIDQIGEAQLANAPQPLELACVEQHPRDSIRLAPMLVFSTEHDQPMNRVADALFLNFAHRNHR